MDADSPPLNFSDPFLTWSYAEDMVVEQQKSTMKKEVEKKLRENLFYMNDLPCLQPMGALYFIWLMAEVRKLSMIRSSQCYN